MVECPIEAVLAGFPRVELAHLPTPLEPLPCLSQHVGEINIYIKRDDCTGLFGGGNKTRKLEFVVGEALQQGIDTLITAGGPQSNHARQTAAVAAKYGMRCVLLLEPVFPSTVDMPGNDYLNSGNLLLSRLAGADVRLLSSGEDLTYQLQEVADGERDEGRRPLIIPVGASSVSGSLGYVDCAREILAQTVSQGIAIDHIVLATGSCGTQAGLLAGLLMAKQKLPVSGIAVGPDDNQAFRQRRVEQLLRETLERLGVDSRKHGGSISVLGDFHCGGYGVVNRELLDVIADVARLEGILLDPVYSGKAMLGLLHLVQEGYFQRGDNVLFLHTGGVPALFAYRSSFEDG